MRKGARMGKCQIIAIANQKGGVGKTTTTFSLGVALSKQGKRVLLIRVESMTKIKTTLTIEKSLYGGF